MQLATAIAWLQFTLTFHLPVQNALPRTGSTGLPVGTIENTKVDQRKVDWSQDPAGETVILH